MINIEHVVLPSPEQWEFVIEGMRNPYNSWDKSDSDISAASFDALGYPYGDEFTLGDNDKDLALRLTAGGPVNRKYLRQLVVYARITAPLYWWKEFDTYRMGVEKNSCSTMHKITDKEFTPEDFSIEDLGDLNIGGECMYNFAKNSIRDTIKELNILRREYLKHKASCDISKEELKKYWRMLIQLLPSSYNQTRNVMMSYEALANMHYWRWNHRLYEWVSFSKWVRSLPYSEIFTLGIPEGLSDS